MLDPMMTSLCQGMSPAIIVGDMDRPLPGSPTTTNTMGERWDGCSDRKAAAR